MPGMSSRTATADFCIQVDFQKDSPNPARVFRTLTNLIERFETLDQELVHSINANIKPILLLEDIEAGSLKAWLKALLEEVDDDALKNLDWKPQVGKYLVTSKYILIRFLQENATITSRAQIDDLSLKLLRSAEETDVLRIPTYAPLPASEIANTLRLLSEATAPLQAGDSVKYITDDSEANFNLTFRVSPQTIEDLLTERTITSPNEMILKVKKPDFLGDSMWAFKHDSRPIEAKILDDEWLTKFQNREEEVRPGDSLRVAVDIEVKYGFDAEVVATHYLIRKVIEVMKAKTHPQEGLF